MVQLNLNQTKMYHNISAQS